MPPVSIRSRFLSGRRDRGAILIVALLVAAIIGISLVSYLKLAQNSLNLANRSFYNTASINLAETGVEEALWSFNQVTAGTALATAWSGWNTDDGVTAKRTFTDFTLPNNATASVKVYVDNYNPSGSTQPKVIAQSTITIPNENRTLTKWVELTLRRRSRFAMGLVAKNQITFKGNTASVDSWNSLYNDDGTPRGSAVAYSSSVAHDHGSVGSTAVAVGSVAINNADIWGYASVGGSSTSDVSVGNNGTIAAFGQPTGTIDTTRIATDFTTNLESESEPTTGTVIGSVGSSLGTAGTTTTLRYSGDITSSFTVYGNVTLVLTGSNEVMKLTGGDQVSISAGSSLTIYTAGDIDIGGNGVVNANSQASSFKIYGTNTTSQSIAIKGTSNLAAMVYAPMADLTINGTPDVLGSIVGNTITVTGNAKFHYDEALANYGGSNPWGVVKWRELVTSSDRNTYATVMSGW